MDESTSPAADPSTSASRSAARRADAAAKAAASAATVGAATPETRRRRLPARLPAVIFFVLGFVALWASFLEASVDAVWGLGTAFTFALQAIPPVVAVLIPGALLWRHPDAPHRARTLLFGTLLFASVTFFRAIEGGLQATFKELTPPPTTDLAWFVPASLAFTSFVALIGLFGLLYIGLGLSKARNYAYTKRSRDAGLVILVVAVLSILGRLWTLTQVDIHDPTLTWDLWVYIGSIILIGILTILTWTYVTRTLVRCAIAGEEPVSAWNVAAVGSVLILLTYLIVAWSTFVTISDNTLSSVILYTRQILTAVGHLALLAGFGLALPSLERVIWDDEEPDAVA